MIMTRVAAELTGPPVSLRNRPREVVQQPDLAEVFAGSEGGDQAWRGLVVLRAEHSEPALVVEVGKGGHLTRSYDRLPRPAPAEPTP
jgi:hypothetical protein